MALSWSLFGLLVAMCLALLGALYVLLARMDSLRVEFNGGLTGLRGEMHELRRELKSEMQELRGDLRSSLSDVDRRLRGGGL